MVDDETKKDLVRSMLEKGFLVSEDLFIGHDDKQALTILLSQKAPGQLALLNPDSVSLLGKQITDINWMDLEAARAIAEKENDSTHYKRFLDCVKSNKGPEKCIPAYEGRGLKIVFDYEEPVSKKDVGDFVGYYNSRFRQIEGLLRNRQELSGLTSIARILQKRDRENVAIIGIVSDKTTTTGGHVMLKLEDRTGEIRVLVNNSKQELFLQAKDTVLDEVVGVTGMSGDGIVFCTGLLNPDIPLNKELKKSPEEVYAIFLSDLHVGSVNFLDKKLDKFIRWLRGEVGTKEHAEIIKKIKYIFIAGDLVDGVGIYPNQETELTIKDVYEQYEECARYLSRIPGHIQVVVCPGNHDSIRLSEPQPAFDRQFAAPLFRLPNITLVSNPGIVNIAATDGFSGFDVLLYHGYSFDYYISNVDSIRNNGGYDRADLVMKFLLQRRHLAPSHTSTLYVPDSEKDPLFISRVPDFFVSGHIHKSYVSGYRNVSMICGSCWQSTTSFQRRVGHNPEPAYVPLVNLQTRQTKILRF